MRNDISNIVASEAAIQERISEMALEITKDYASKPLTVIIVANGAVFFAVDLLRLIPLNLQLDILAISSYIGRHSSNEILVRSQLKIDLKDRHVLIIDDIYDTGQTLGFIEEELRNNQPRDIRTCVLLEKRRDGRTGRRPDYAGFQIADEFVVGYGLDYNECYRNLPYIGVLADDLTPPS